ncbi:MAG: peptidoglycan DD-metalloendopeptidase family protein [Defluviitaleaceae bacterium]|nr:peptidoglycan DD-metalloendopeptidase family protein [Defluviitaleaceae bacterium]
MINKSERKFRLKQSVAILCASIFFLSLGSAAMANNNNITELQEQRQSVTDNINEMRSLLNQAQTERNDTMAEIIQLDIELAEVTNEYLIALENLEIVTTLLNIAQIDLIEAEQQREIQFEVLRNRLRSIHENSPMGYIELLLSSGSVAEFLNNMEHFGRIIEHDNNMLEMLIETEERIAQNMQDIVEHHAQAELLTIELEGRIADLEATLVARGARIEELESNAESHQIIIDQLDEERQEFNLLIAAAQAQADAARAQNASSQNNRTVTVSSDAPFVWPVDGVRGVNSGYGNRTHPISGRSEFHTGLDLRGAHGTPILAADEGHVTFAGWMRGYGNTIIIDHGVNAAGQRISTLYAHNSVNHVSTGQWVARGQHIANVGSTGISTGPHLHFEVMINGNHTNPGPFLGIH